MNKKIILSLSLLSISSLFLASCHKPYSISTFDCPITFDDSKKALSDDFIDLLDEFGLYSFETRPGYWFSDRLTGEKKWIQKAPGPVYISKIPFDKEV